jgi:glucosamine-6-phosphate deaminase
MPDANIHFPTDLESYSRTYNDVRCLVMQGGQGEVKHWAFNEPPKRAGKWQHEPPPSTYPQLKTRITELHPMTVIQNARTSGGGYVSQVPTCAATVGPMETWKADGVSIWHPGHHDNPFGIRLTALMISKRVPDSSVPMSLLADHPCVKFNYLRDGIGNVTAEMH